MTSDDLARQLVGTLEKHPGTGVPREQWETILAILSALKPGDRFNGMVVVPEKPSKEMQEAAAKWVIGERFTRSESLAAHYCYGIYRAMIAAAKEEE